MTKTERDPLAQIRLQTAAIIPAYQDEKHIGDIVRRTRQRLDRVLVVDDGSSDQTAQRAREAGAEVIVHDQNRGKGEAIKTGLAHWLAAANSSRHAADGLGVTWVSLLDSDGQHLPEEIDRFLAAAASSTQPTFLIGNRMNNLAGMPFFRRIVNRYMSGQISRACKQEIPDTQCGFRMLDHQLVPQLLGPESVRGFDYDTEVLIIASRKGYRIESVPITTVYTDQVSKIRPLRDAIRFLKLMWRYRKPA
jgi:glycosyltransferase involved in cell wall biosynthesis